MQTNVLPSIVIGYGTATMMQIDLTAADMSRGPVILSIRRSGTEKVLIRQEFTTAAVHEFVIGKNFVKENKGAQRYEYDLIQNVDGVPYKLTEIGTITVVDTVGGHAE